MGQWPRGICVARYDFGSNSDRHAGRRHRLGVAGRSLSFGVLARCTQHMLSLAAGALMATAFMHLLPRSVRGQRAHDLFLVLLLGLVFFFLLDKAELCTMDTTPPRRAFGGWPWSRAWT